MSVRMGGEGLWMWYLQVSVGGTSMGMNSSRKLNTFGRLAQDAVGDWRFVDQP